MSVCSLVHSGSQRFISPCVQMFQGTAPLCAVSCKMLSGHSGDDAWADILNALHACMYVRARMRMRVRVRVCVCVEVYDYVLV